MLVFWIVPSDVISVLGTLRSDDVDSNENVTEKLLRVLSDVFVIIPSFTFFQNLGN